MGHCSADALLRSVGGLLERPEWASDWVVGRRMKERNKELENGVTN